MNNAWARAICRMLIVLMAWAPFQYANAGMIGTDQVVTHSAQADRTTVMNFLSRADVAGQLQTFGLDARTAKDRVAAMTDEEVRSLAGQVEALPAGANSSGWVVLIIIIAVIWWVATRR